MSMLNLALVLPWVFLGLWSWMGFQVLRQNGRFLILLEGLEARLEALGRAPQAAAVDSPAAAPEGLPIGSPAPAFALPDLHGKTHALAEFQGRKVLLMFFGPRCGYCLEALPEIAAMAADGRGGTPVPLVVTTGTKKENREIFERHAIRSPILLQKGMEVASLYQAHGTPMGYLIDEDGKVASELAVGSQALLALARGPGAVGGEAAASPAETNGTRVGKPQRGNRPLSTSRLKRDGLGRGTPAPGFRLPRVDGGELDLADYLGRAVLLVFSDPQCGPCDALAPRLEEVHRQDPDLRVVMVSRRDMDANRKKVAAVGITFPVGVQTNWEVSMLYGMFATPIGYLIDERGVLASDVAVGVEPILALAAGARASTRNSNHLEGVGLGS